MQAKLTWTVTLIVAGLTGCASVPTGPTVMVLPGVGRTFESFQVDDNTCRQFAFAQSGGKAAADTQAASGIESAAVGTAVGAAAGAALGGQRGAAQGAGAGLLVGSMAGTGAADASVHSAQRLYNNAYVQCMYAKGHQVPAYGQPRSDTYRSDGPPAGAASMPPPPDMPPPR